MQQLFKCRIHLQSYFSQITESLVFFGVMSHFSLINFPGQCRLFSCTLIVLDQLIQYQILQNNIIRIVWQATQ